MTETKTERKWYVVDAAGVPLGRLGAAVAQVLRGKHKPTFSYSEDVGDHVIVINAAQIRLTGNSKPDELIYWHSGYPGGIKSVSRGKLLKDKPEKLVEKVVWGMLPKNRLGRRMIKRLHVYQGAEHKHENHNLETLEVKS
ncbi:MAG: 50S ribosomal protein L13 [Armatimonadetes bacterium]|nr:MAG: 50S ribosomal protein L13 [Armatimonadota bacterium]GIV03398.1 MAG: 50S ribosomal protein L13 [Fimbriimonadales bacterium]